MEIKTFYTSFEIMQGILQILLLFIKIIGVWNSEKERERER